MNPIESGMRFMRPVPQEAIQPQPDVSAMPEKLAALTPEQSEQLDRSIEADSRTFFELMQAAMKKIEEKLVTAYEEKGEGLSETTVMGMFIAEGIGESDAREAAETVATAAKHADSSEQFTHLLAKQFDPNSRLLQAMDHWHTRSPHSWYMATAAGQERLEQLLGRLV